MPQAAGAECTNGWPMKPELAGHQLDCVLFQGRTKASMRAVPEPAQNVDQSPVRSEEGVAEKGSGD